MGGEQPEANENDTVVDSVGKVSAALAAWKYMQHRDLSHRSGVLYPSPAFSDMAFSSQSASEVGLPLYQLQPHTYLLPLPVRWR